MEVLRLDDLHEEQDEGEGHRLDKRDKPMSFGFAEARCSNPTRNLNSAVDIVAWLAELPAEDRHMLELRAAGFTLEETADEVGVPLTAVFANCRRLGLALAERAGIPIEPRKHKDRRAEEQPTSTRRPRSSTADTSAKKMGGLRKASGTRRSEAARCAA